jgi:hypothetical protein
MISSDFVWALAKLVKTMNRTKQFKHFFIRLTARCRVLPRIVLRTGADNLQTLRTS